MTGKDGSLDLSNFCQKRQNPFSKRLILYGQITRVRLDLTAFRRAGSQVSDKTGKRLLQCADKLD